LAFAWYSNDYTYSSLTTSSCQPNAEWNSFKVAIYRW